MQVPDLGLLIAFSADVTKTSAVKTNNTRKITNDRRGSQTKSCSTPRTACESSDPTLRLLSASPHQAPHHTTIKRTVELFHFNFRSIITLIFLLCAYAASAVGQPTCSNPIPTRPILFVHGIWEDSSAWGADSASGLRGDIISALSAQPGYSNPSNIDLYYSNIDNNVHISTGPSASSSDLLAVGNIPCDARFFSIRFFGWSGLTTAFDPSAVAGISVITKAFELSQVIKAITASTYVKDVIVVAHSLGALDSRAYLEGLGSSIVPCTATPCWIEGNQVPYTNDIAEIITVDGANAGANAAYLGLFLSPPPQLNVEELTPNSAVIQALNYIAPYKDSTQSYIWPYDVQAPVVALVSYFRDQTNLLCATSFSFSCGSDGAVQTDSQSIVQALQNHPMSNISDLNASWNEPPGNTYMSNDTTIVNDSYCQMNVLTDVIHLLPC